jgi:cytochrome b subunit of formate dehydrogenase
MISNNEIVDLILDENCSPVARMRLFSDGVNVNNRITFHDHIVGDRACLACGNCVDICPVVKDNNKFIFLQNQRTSMALENLVGEECRRCYRCIKACPQIGMDIKDYSSGYRRGEKIIHLLFAGSIASLALTGMTLLHYGEILPKLELNLLRFAHRGLGVLFILIPVLYFLIDKWHLLRICKKVLAWGKKDFRWIKDFIYHLGNYKKHPMPFRTEFNPLQKTWYLFIIGMIPSMSVTGVILWALDGDPFQSAYVSTKMVHMSVALTTDILLFVHVYIKYMRPWAIIVFNIVNVFIKKGHWDYSLLFRPKEKVEIE